MNLTVGRTTLGRSRWPGFGALLAGLATVGILAGVGIWQATESDSRTPSAPPVVARPADLPRDVPTTAYVYLVDSQAAADQIYQASFETQMGFGADGAFNQNIRVIDISTPAGREEYNLLNAELAQQYLENPAFDASLVQVIDLTAPAAVGAASEGAAATNGVAATEAPSIPTFFYIVETQEQADFVLYAENMSQLEATQAGTEVQPHETVIVDVSTPEGLQLYQTINGGLFEMWDNPEFDQSLVQIIDVR